MAEDEPAQSGLQYPLRLDSQTFDPQPHHVAGLQETGSGSCQPTPGGVPVAITSPACSVMKWLT